MRRSIHPSWAVLRSTYYPFDQPGGARVYCIVARGFRGLTGQNRYAVARAAFADLNEQFGHLTDVMVRAAVIHSEALAQRAGAIELRAEAAARRALRDLPDDT